MKQNEVHRTINPAQIPSLITGSLILMLGVILVILGNNLLQQGIGDTLFNIYAIGFLFCIVTGIIILNYGFMKHFQYFGDKDYENFVKKDSKRGNIILIIFTINIIISLTLSSVFNSIIIGFVSFIPAIIITLYFAVTFWINLNKAIFALTKVLNKK